MIAKELYDCLEKDFRLSICHDDWSEMGINQYITQNYRERYMGLVTDSADEINYVYTAVFPSPEVIGKIIGDNSRDALLFVHHPMNWDITRTPVFSDIPPDDFQALKEQKISIYNLHVPLDANGLYGTTYNFANALGISMTDEFEEYGGVNVGIIGVTEYNTVAELQQRFESVAGHEVKLYPYGGEIIKDGKAALVAGGGNDAEVYPFLREQGINVYLTGIANRREYYQPSVEAHNAAKECGINILAGTHYSTEKFACIKMVEYFSRLGLQGEFIHDRPCIEDM